MKPRILGLDPGFANIGWGVVELHPTNPAEDAILSCGVFRTEKSDKKRQVAASDDNLRRGREITAELQKLIELHNVSAICAESMSFPRNASAAAKVAMCWGVVAALVHQKRLPLSQSSPQEIKRLLCGKKDASKEDVAAAVRKRYPAIGPMVEEVIPSAREHAFDAVAAILASLETSDVVRVLRLLHETPR